MSIIHPLGLKGPSRRQGDKSPQHNVSCVRSTRHLNNTAKTLKAMEIDVYLGLGSNLDDPFKQIKAGLSALSRLPHTTLKTTSTIYRTAPVGFLDQPDFLNAVCHIETQLSPDALLDALLAIERAQLRTRGDEKNGPRTLDLDILIYGQKQISTDRLEIPHPRLTERAFALIPLTEIAPNLVLACGRKVKDLANSPTLASSPPIKFSPPPIQPLPWS